MIKFTLVLLFFTCLLQYGFSQHSTIRGTVLDTLDKRTLNNAVIALLSKKDSSLQSFTRSGTAGDFTLNNVRPGRYVLFISYPRFADYADDLTVRDSSDLALGVIPLTHKSELLKEVVIISSQAIRIKGDTTEFAADSFVVREGATVDELLKKLPGFTVNSKGEITAQGKKVDKVLVDGEEFFGDDPTMATQNIAARAVDRVQVFDTKSDQQNLKGISTGDEGKTVNIRLKDDQKKGAFGKVEGGTNFNNLNDAKGMYNYFIGKKKVSVYATKSNTNTGSLDWQDRQKLGLEDNDLEYDEVGGYYYSFGSSNDFSDWSLRGLPDSYTAGALYSNRWNADKKHINGSYRFNRLGTVSQTNIRTQNVLPDTLFYTNQSTRTNGLNEQSAFDIKYEWKIDSLASIKFTSADLYKNTKAYNNTYSESLDEDSAFVNNSNRINDVARIRKQSDNVLTYKQLFAKKGRQLLATLRMGITGDQQTDKLAALTRFYQRGNLNYADTLDQQKFTEGNSVTFGSKITYSEPLSLTWNMIAEYSYNQNNSEAHRNTYDRDFNGKYEALNTLFSNNFKVNATANSGTATFRYIGKKLKFAAGSGLSSVKLRLNNLDTRLKNTFHFLNITPQLQLGYNLKQQTSISLRYQGTTRQPGIDQLQPIRDNSDPLNVFTGNPDLKVGFNHNVGLNYNSYKVLKGRYMYVGTGLNVLQNAITNSYQVDNFGKKTFMPVNVNGNQNWYVYSGYRHGQGEKKWIYGFDINGSGGKNTTFVNSRQNTTRYANISFNTSTGYSVTDKYNVDIRPQFSYNYSLSTFRPDVRNRYFTYGGDAEAFVMLPGKFELNSNINFTLRQRTQLFNTNIDVITWNANLAKKVFKKKTGKVILSANDILNQNKGIERTINSSFITEQTYLRRSRYIMLKFEWTFNKMPGN